MIRSARDQTWLSDQKWQNTVKSKSKYWNPSGLSTSGVMKIHQITIQQIIILPKIHSVKSPLLPKIHSVELMICQINLWANLTGVRVD